MNALLPDRLKEIWERVDTGELTAETAQQWEESLLNRSRATWTAALLREGEVDLKHSLLRELATYLGEDDVGVIEARCRAIGQELRDDWQRIVAREGSILDRAVLRPEPGASFELTWWHTLVDDQTPLAYVLALEFARRHPGRRYLDFGAGIGSRCGPLRPRGVRGGARRHQLAPASIRRMAARSAWAQGTDPRSQDAGAARPGLRCDHHDGRPRASRGSCAGRRSTGGGPPAWRPHLRPLRGARGSGTAPAHRFRLRADVPPS